MKERIKQFMDHKGISAGELATILEVQRSNISHILNGRNKPGAAFIEKLLITYPDLNARWLLTGDGIMKESHKNNMVIESEVTTKDESIGPKINKHIEINKLNAPQTVEDKHIDKVVLLMSDGTFIDYTKK